MKSIVAYWTITVVLSLGFEYLVSMCSHGKLTQTPVSHIGDEDAFFALRENVNIE